MAKKCGDCQRVLDFVNAKQAEVDVNREHAVREMNIPQTGKVDIQTHWFDIKNELDVAMSYLNVVEQIITHKKRPYANKKD
jgi:hypothetical protein